MDHVKQQAAYVARLAHLRLSGAELKTMARDMESILDYIGRLEELELDEVQPLFNPAAADDNVWREDETGTDDISDEFLRGAPDVRDRYLMVPQVVASDEVEGEDDDM